MPRSKSLLWSNYSEPKSDSSGQFNTQRVTCLHCGHKCSATTTNMRTHDKHCIKRPRPVLQEIKREKGKEIKQEKEKDKSRDTEKDTNRNKEGETEDPQKSNGTSRRRSRSDESEGDDGENLDGVEPEWSMRELKRAKIMQDIAESKARELEFKIREESARMDNKIKLLRERNNLRKEGIPQEEIDAVLSLD